MFWFVIMGECNGFFTPLYNMGLEGEVAFDLLFFIVERKHLYILGHRG